MNKEKFLEVLEDGIDGVKYGGVFYNVNFADEEGQVLELTQTDSIDIALNVSYDTLLKDKELKVYRWEEVK